MFMGRIVENKGVYDVIEIARDLNERRKGDFYFDICGDGEDLPAARQLTKELGLGGAVVCHGFCDTEKLRTLLGASHASIVPTRSDFEAGFEMTCAEAILAGRPLVTSRVCPALEYLTDASVEVRPDDVGAYRDAIVRLRDDVDFYEKKRKACASLQEQFYDCSNSWYAAMRRALERHAPSLSFARR
jgi:glycosyltransferase involved in cell wall biosynthesis